MSKSRRKAKPKPNLDAALSAVAKEHIVARAVRIQGSPDTIESPGGVAESGEAAGDTAIIARPLDAAADVSLPRFDPPVEMPIEAAPVPTEALIPAPEPAPEAVAKPAMSAEEIAARYAPAPDPENRPENPPEARRIEPVLRRAPETPPQVAGPALQSALTGDDGPRLVTDNSGLQANGLGKRFKQRPVLRGVSVSVQRGEIVGLLGPNGAGKTTCFYIITGLIAPDYGSISLDGEDLTDLPMYRRARMGIGYLPQEPSIFRGLSVENNIRAVLEVVEDDRDVREARLDELLAEFSITHIRRSPALALSGGERRRVEIARALATNPHFVLLDEPLAGIDPIALSDIRDLVIHLKDRGIGVLITDHNVRETLEVVDRAYIIHEGVVLMSGQPSEIVAHEDVRRVYLGEKFSL